MPRPESFSEADMITVLQQTKSVEEASRLLGCSAQLIHLRARESGQLQQAVRDQQREFELQLAKAIMQHKGILSKVAREVGMDSSQAVRYHIVRSSRLKEIYLESREGMVDLAEDNIFRAVEMGNLGYSWKLLQTLGKERGYTERKEIDSVHVHVAAAPTNRLVELLDRHAQQSPELVEEALGQLSESDRKLLGSALTRHAGDAVEGELISAEDCRTAEGRSCAGRAEDETSDYKMAEGGFCADQPGKEDRSTALYQVDTEPAIVEATA
jgi:hypothetical protein